MQSVSFFLNTNTEKVLQWNCRSVVSKKSDLIYLINKYKPRILALQETWLKPGHSFRIPGYACLREDRSDGYNGVAILIKHSLPFTHLPIPNHSHEFSIIAVSIENICFVSIYIPHPSSHIIQEVADILSTLPKPFIMLGDLNCHHQAWGSSLSNSVGNFLLDLLDLQNLCVLNTGTPTRRTEPGQLVSAPDLSVCTPSLASLFTWETLSLTYGSDHFPIILSFTSNCSNLNRPIPKKKPCLQYCLADADWHTFSERLESRTADLPNLHLGDESFCAEVLAKKIIEVADETFPHKKEQSDFIPSPPWWDSECTDAVRKRKEAELTYNECSTTDNLNLLLTVMSDTRKLFKTKKFESWKLFCLSLSPNVNPSLVWRNIRRFRSAFRDTSSTFLPSALNDPFLDKLAPPSVPEQIIIPTPLSSEVISNPIGLNSPFSLSELKGVLDNVKDSAPGLDGIPYSFISHLSDNTLSYFLNLINSIMVTGNIPSSWKSQLIIPILKPNKSPSEYSSYRPIALSSVLMKVTEHLIKVRLEWFIESNQLLSESQFGFRKGKSTHDSIGIFVTDIRIAFSKNHSVVAAFLDINAAYDNVILSILKNKLQALNVPIMLSNFIINMLSERFINISLEDGTMKSRNVWKGLPQGSVLSPILYNIYTSDLESALDGNVNILQYADDLLLYYPHQSVEKACSSLTSSLSLLKEWLHNNGLELSPAKSSVVLFTRRRLPPPMSVYYDNTEIPVKTNVKFLGLILDSKMTGEPHCDYLVGKCERLLNILKCLSGVWWGSHPFCMKLLYNALIRSLLDYGTFLLEPGSTIAFKNLDSIQSKALRLVSGAMKSSPINALQVECVDPPLQLRRQYLSDSFLFRSLQFSNHPLHSKLRLLSDYASSSSYWSHKSIPCLLNSFRKWTNLQAPTHQVPSFPLFCTNFEPLIISPDVRLDLGITKNDPFANVTFCALLDENWPDYNYIYTDASKHSSTDYVGVGVYHSQYDIVQRVKLPPESSVFTGECFAIFKALEYILIFKLHKTVIFSDSMSALQALSRYPFRSKSFPLIIDIRDKLFKCQQLGFVVTFAWIPGHNNIHGNIKADQLANKAVEDGDMFPYKNYCLDLGSLPKVYLRDDWRHSWIESCQTKAKHYFSIQNVIPPKPWFFKIKLCKRSTSTIIRMRLGHVCSPAHLAKLQIVQSDACECGTGIGDTNHLFLSCPLLDHSPLYAFLHSLKVPLPTSIPVLLHSMNPEIYKCLSSFIMNNNLKL